MEEAEREEDVVEEVKEEEEKVEEGQTCYLSCNLFMSHIFCLV